MAAFTLSTRVIRRLLASVTRGECCTALYGLYGMCSACHPGMQYQTIRYHALHLNNREGLRSPLVPIVKAPRAVLRSRAQSLPSTGGAGAPGSVAVEAVVPGLDFCNHSVAPSCRWTVEEGSQVRMGQTPL